ncbi:MAG: hypothetical protein ACR2OY_11175 [Boseongicola sp.]
MTRPNRNADLELLSQVAALRTVRAQANLTAIDGRISAIRGQISDAKSPLNTTPADITDAVANDRWIRSRQKRVVALNSALAQEMAEKPGAARLAAQASAVEGLLGEYLHVEKSRTARRKARRSEEVTTNPQPQNKKEK